MMTHSFGKLANDLLRLPDDVRKNTRDLVRKIAIGVTQSLIMSTPVDTGWARANWQVSLRSPILEPVDNIDKSGSQTVQLARAVSLSFELRDQVIHVTNNVPYIGALNNGHSPQASAGFIERSVENVEFIVKAHDLTRKNK